MRGADDADHLRCDPVQKDRGEGLRRSLLWHGADAAGGQTGIFLSAA